MRLKLAAQKNKKQVSLCVSNVAIKRITGSVALVKKKALCKI